MSRKLGSKGRISWFLHKFGESISVIHVLCIHMWLFSLFAGDSIGMTHGMTPYKCSPNKKLAYNKFRLRSPTNIYEQDHDPVGDLLQAWAAWKITSLHHFPKVLRPMSQTLSEFYTTKSLILKSSFKRPLYETRHKANPGTNMYVSSREKMEKRHFGKHHSHVRPSSTLSTGVPFQK